MTPAAANLRISTFIVLLLLAGVPASQGQATGTASGIVTGTVADETGGVLPGVSVQLRPAGATASREIITDERGAFRLDAVPPGPAEIAFRLINFSTVRRNLVVTSGGAVTADAVMLVAMSADIAITAPRTFRNLAEVENPPENLVGVASASSEGGITAKQIEARPLNRAAEVLEAVPGLVISQHSGEGKANQYYLRGFDLDHGFDFATTIAGIPVNLPTHAHAQGYADVNFLIPELVSGVQFRKGPYFAENGDFSSAGSATVNYFNVLDAPLVSVAGGSFGYGRFLGAASPRVGRGYLLAAIEYERDDGPWVQPNDKGKYNGLLRYSQGDARNGLSLTFMGYANEWRSTDQVPLRAVESGLIDRFGFIEDTDRGETFRYSGAFDWQRSGTYDSTRLTAYTQRYGVQLFHNFTYFLNDPDSGDQFEQLERRWTTGAKLTHRRVGRMAGKGVEHGFGVDTRNDVIAPLGLHLTRKAERISTVREDEVNQLAVGGFGQTEIEWSRTVRTRLGLRGDIYRWNVESDTPVNSGSEVSAIASPKASIVLGPWGGTELYGNWGLGFHSNAAAGILARVDPATGDPTPPSSPFARSNGAEVGVRTVRIPGLQTTATLWFLGFDSELVYVADAGHTEEGPASRRVGVEITNYLSPHPWVSVDLDVSFSRARFVDLPAGESYVPGALNRVVSGGIGITPPRGVRAGPFGSVRLRHFGPRPLIEDNSVRSDQTSIVNGEIGYKFSNRVRLALEGFNLLNAQVSDIDYFFESRLRDELEPVEDVHFHAAIPRSARVVLQVGF